MREAHEGGKRRDQPKNQQGKDCECRKKESMKTADKGFFGEGTASGGGPSVSNEPHHRPVATQLKVVRRKSERVPKARVGESMRGGKGGSGALPRENF